MITVTLTREQAKIAILRGAEYMFNKHDLARTDSDIKELSRNLTQRWAYSILGAMGEYAASLIFDLPLPVITRNVTHGDLGEGIEVRTTEYPKGEVPIEPNDKEGSIILSMTGHYPTLTYRGWISVEEGRRDGVFQEAGSIRYPEFGKPFPVRQDSYWLRQYQLHHSVPIFPPRGER